MPLTLALAQSGYPADGDVIFQVDAFAARARAAGAQLLAFPENLMHPHRLHGDELGRLAEPLDGPFLHELARIAARHKLWMVGTFNESNPDDGRPYNTAFVLDDGGTLRSSYRKCHLYDAHRERESERLCPGETLFEPIVTPFCTLGVAICYDLRFPEVARAAALAGCELLLYPACWHDGPLKAEHWGTLLRARAIENEMWVAGICHAGEGYVEQSVVVGPLGEVVAKAQPGEDIVVTCIDIDAIRAARNAMPVLQHRHPELYHPVVNVPT